MKVGFSASTKGFYLLGRKETYILNHHWPDDIKPVSDEIFYHYSGEPPEGKVRGSDEQGLPCWTSKPLVSESEQTLAFRIMKNFKLSEAIDKINELEIISSVTALTASDKSALAEWKIYLSSVYNMTESDNYGVWPVRPAE